MITSSVFGHTGMYLLDITFFLPQLWVLVICFQPSEKSKYDQVFDSLGPVNNVLSGDKVKPVSIAFFCNVLWISLK